MPGFTGNRDRTRRPLLRLLAAAALLVAAPAVSACGDDFARGGLAPDAREFDPDAPNVIVVMTDDQGAVTMPALPRTRRLLGGGGTTFENALASFPLCCPSRASFLTGQYAHNHGVLDNGPPNGGIGRLDQRRTLPVWLARAGYRTAFVGKYLNGYAKNKNGGPRLVPPGWNEWYAATNDNKTGAYDYEMNENRRLVDYGDAEGDYKTDVMADLASEFVGRRAKLDRPFFLWVATSAPHTDNSLPDDAPRNPLPAPRHRDVYEGKRPPRDPAFNEADVSDKPRFVREESRLSAAQRKEINRKYVSELESLRAVDDLVARLVADLRSAGELDDTLIAFTADNGYLRGQHRLDSGKSKAYDESVRVPLLVRGPTFPAGRRVDNPVANIDLTATIAALAGVDPDHPLDGVPLEDGIGPGGRGRDVLLEVFERKQDRFRAVRNRNWVYIEREDDIAELYDRRRDPDELHNRAREARFGAVRKRLSRRLAELVDCAGESCR